MHSDIQQQDIDQQPEKKKRRPPRVATVQPRWVDEVNAAKHGGYSVSQLQKWRTYGGGPPYSKEGHRVTYDLHAIDKFKQEHIVSNTSQYQTHGGRPPTPPSGSVGVAPGMKA